MTARIANKNDILNLIQERQKSRKRFTIRCQSHNWKDLFTYKYPKKRLQIASSGYSKTLMDTFNRCGIVDLSCEYYPSRLTPEQGVKYDSISLAGFDAWFQKILENKQEIFIDTNIIIYRTLSRVLLNRMSTFQEIARRIRIPRLVLLELEAKYGRAKDDYKRSTEALYALEIEESTQKTRKTALKKPKIQKSREEHEREVSLMLSAQIEVQRLKALGGQITFSPLSAELLAAYYNHAGKGFADAFIRKEILDSTGGGIPFRAIFFTRDLMNALAACAENLDTFYFSNADPDRSHFDVSNDQIVDVIIETAVAFGEIHLDGLVPRKHVVLRGMWPTKSNIDWLAERVLMNI